MDLVQRSSGVATGPDPWRQIIIGSAIMPPPIIIPSDIMPPVRAVFQAIAALQPASPTMRATRPATRTSRLPFNSSRAFEVCANALVVVPPDLAPGIASLQDH